MALFGRLRARPRPDTQPPVAPEAGFVAVGDIHGRLDLLERLLSSVETAGQGGRPLVFVGDYIDRGSQGLEVLAHLHGLSRARGGGCVCLRGNHEEMLLDFLDTPETAGRRWLIHGGVDTLLGCGLDPIPRDASPEAWQALRDAFRDRLGPEREAWLRALPLMWRSGNVAVVHAGGDPAARMGAQRPEHLVWGHPDFLTIPRSDGVWVVHGHTIHEQPEVIRGRIAIDTGAYATGRLTAALVSPGQVAFLTL